MAVVDVEVVLGDPTLGDLKMPAVVMPVADRNHDPRRLTRLEDHHDLIGFGAPEVGRDELVAATGGSFHDRRTPLVRAILNPALELLGDTSQKITAHRVLLAVAAEKADHPFGLLEGLNQSVEENAIETAIAKTDAVLMMLEKGVHATLRRNECGQAYPIDGFSPLSFTCARGISRAKPLAS